MRRTRVLLPLALLVPLAACGGSSDPRALTDTGYEALGASEHERALEAFEEAIEAMDGPAHAEYTRAKLGAIEARIHLDPDAARDAFLALAEEKPLSDRDYSMIGSKLAGAGEFLQAIDVLDAGMQRHAESPVLAKLVDTIKVRAEQAGDEQALSKMAGLGYL